MMAPIRPIVVFLTTLKELPVIAAKRLEGKIERIIALDPQTTVSLTSELLSADILVTEPASAPLWLNKLPNLKLVVGTWAGVDSVIELLDRANPPKFIYCRSSSLYGQPMAEYVLAYMIAHERNFKQCYKEQFNSNWSKEYRDQLVESSRSLAALRIGILGVGTIGARVAEACKAMGMSVWALCTQVPSIERRSPAVEVYRDTSDLPDLLASCDYILNLLPSTPLTRGLLDNDILSHCAARSSVLINTGRGDICRDNSILKALEEKWIRAAVLDVIAEEPLSRDSPLWRHPNVTITPHVAALSHAPLSDTIVPNIESFIDGKELIGAVDWKQGY